MFKIIISELEYFKYFFIFIYGLILLLFLGTIKFEHIDLYFFMSNSSIIFYISVGIIASVSDKEKRERYQFLLPFSVKTMGKQRLLFVILYQATIFLLWLVLYLTGYFSDNSELIWTLISINMFNLIIIGLFVIYTDLGFYGIRFHKPILALIIAGAIFLYSATMLNIKIQVFSVINFGTKSFSAYMDFIKLPYGALFMTLFAGIIYYLSYIVYVNRKSYLK